MERINCSICEKQKGMNHCLEKPVLHGETKEAAISLGYTEQELENCIFEKLPTYSYERIGREAGLVSDQLDLYVKYMNIRWKDTEEQKCKDGYAREWAQRFKDNRVWECSDSEGRQVLLDLGAM